jgi:hypothetical protein
MDTTDCKFLNTGCVLACSSITSLPIFCDLVTLFETVAGFGAYIPCHTPGKVPVIVFLLCHRHCEAPMLTFLPCHRYRKVPWLIFLPYHMRWKIPCPYFCLTTDNGKCLCPYLYLATDIGKIHVPVFPPSHTLEGPYAHRKIPLPIFLPCHRHW